LSAAGITIADAHRGGGALFCPDENNASSGLLASSRTYVHAVDGRDLITTQRLLKSEPKDEGSGSPSHILSSVEDTNLGVDIAMPSRILSSRLDGLRRI